MADQKVIRNRDAESLLANIVPKYLAALRPVLDEALSVDRPLADLLTVPVPGAPKYEGLVRGYLRAVFDHGRHSLSAELEQTQEGAVPNLTRTWINVRAQVMAADHMSQLRTTVLYRLLSGIRAEMDTAQIFSDAAAVAIEELSRNTERDWSAAAAEVLALLDAGQ